VFSILYKIKFENDGKRKLLCTFPEQIESTKQLINLRPTVGIFDKQKITFKHTFHSLIGQNFFRIKYLCLNYELNKSFQIQRSIINDKVIRI